MFDLNNKVAVITGASGYLGKSMAEGLLEQQCNVILFGRGQKIIDTHAELQDEYRTCKVDYYNVDFYNTEEYKRCLENCVESNDKIDILINNSFDFSKDIGFNCDEGRFENLSKEMFLKGMESSIYWHLLAIQVIGEKMKQQKSGSIINISSMYGSKIVPDVNNLYEGTDSFNPVTYSIGKGGLHHGLTKYCSVHYSKYNIRVNSISPGAFPNLGGGRNKGNNIVVDRLIKKTPLGRVGHPKDLKSAIVFLADDGSSFMTGQNLIIDGGMTII